MDWYESVVRINNGIQEGTGFFVKNDLIMTAAHVLQPRASDPVAGDDISITLPWTGNQECSVLDAFVHPLWTRSQLLPCDLAFLRVDGIPDLGIVPWMDFWSTDDPYEVGLYGYPARASKGHYQHGFLKQKPDKSNPGRYMLMGNGFQIKPGMSGGPFLYQHENGNVYAIGIATWDSNAPGQEDEFNGVPFDIEWQEFVFALNS